MSIAADRNASYDRGDTKNEVWGDGDSAGKHEVGVAGELAIVGLYRGLGAEIDTSVSASGDGGVDCEMEIDGEMRTVDIKSSTYNEDNASLMVAQDHVEARNIIPDVYISCYVSEDLTDVVVRGMVMSDDLFVEDNLAEPKAHYIDGLNYDVSVDELDPMPEPETDSMVEGNDYRVVRS
ncbi:hypothetical protein PM023_13050 [Halorubrum ezzemoulense]|uniref:hypothetical protein n=1 Tax=Halorubrum ezzemoulense TaxID=337243 RepID=UPI00232ADA6C|nr:hypothetical protein [Halorubrum ezzemoulense]MDB2225597.1 hypothetical protein [Halorubrum ezzemoulense]